MKLVMTLLVRDEEDILAANIEYHLSRGVDFIIATDNLSVDATPEILDHYRAAGVVEWMRETSDDYAQSTWVTRMARLAHDRHGADWVINNDADEFWWPDEGGSLKDVLGALPGTCAAVAAGRTNFLPWADARTGSFFETMVVRERRSYNALGKPLLPKVCHRGRPGIDVGQGNHRVSIEGAPIPTCDAPVSILHFPIRSYEQFENKIVKGGAAYGRNRSLPANIGSTWRRLYEVYLAGGLPDAYLGESITDDEVARRADELVVDERLRDYLHHIGIGRSG